MPLTKVPARDFDFDINSLYPTSTAWVPINGLTGLVPAPKTTQTDTTDFLSAGRAEHMVLERGLEFTISGHYIEDVGTAARDPGQAAVETLGNAVGLASIGQFRLTSPGGTIRTFLASAEVTSGGGALNDAGSWQAKITVTGPIT